MNVSECSKSISLPQVAVHITRLSPRKPALEPFCDGARYAAIGDSITQEGWYTLYIDLFYQTRFPNRKIDVFDCGISGDTSEGGLRRYDWDCAAKRPTVVSIMFGMNDVNRDLYSPTSRGAAIERQRDDCIANWERNTRALLERFKRADVPVILVTPSIFDDTSTMATPNFPGCNSGLGQIARIAVEMARQENVGLVDFYHPMTALNQKVQATNPDASIIGPDRVHPGSAGHLYMAYLFLAAQGVTAKSLSCAIDAQAGTVTASHRCRVSDLKADARGLFFTRAAEALPFPTDPAAAEAIAWEPAIGGLNRELLVVSNLEPGSYELLVDEKSACFYTARELGDGVNLAAETTLPQCRQAFEVLDLIKAKWELIRVIRSIALGDSWGLGLTRPFSLAQMEPFLQAKIEETARGPWAQAVAEDVARYRENKERESEVSALNAEMTPRIRAAAQPRSHLYHIRRV